MEGKDKCEFLKWIRKSMAEANGIPYEPRKCTYEGECTGMCPFCEKEAAELMAALKKKEAEGTEIKTHEAGILAIELLKDYKWADYQDANGEENNMEVKVLPGSLMNPIDEYVDIPEPPIDPFRGPNNPFMSGKDLHELRQELNNIRSKLLMGDIDNEKYRKLKEEELRRLHEENIRIEQELNRELRGRIIEETFDEEKTDR